MKKILSMLGVVSLTTVAAGQTMAMTNINQIKYQELTFVSKEKFNLLPNYYEPQVEASNVLVIFFQEVLDFLYEKNISWINSVVIEFIDDNNQVKHTFLPIYSHLIWSLMFLNNSIIIKKVSYSFDNIEGEVVESFNILHTSNIEIPAQGLNINEPRPDLDPNNLPGFDNLRVKMIMDLI